MTKAKKTRRREMPKVPGWEWKKLSSTRIDLYSKNPGEREVWAWCATVDGMDTRVERNDSYLYLLVRGSKAVGGPLPDGESICEAVGVLMNVSPHQVQFERREHNAYVWPTREVWEHWKKLSRRLFPRPPLVSRDSAVNDVWKDMAEDFRRDFPSAFRRG